MNTCLVDVFDMLQKQTTSAHGNLLTLAFSTPNQELDEIVINKPLIKVTKNKIFVEFNTRMTEGSF